MLMLPASVRIYVASGPVDLRNYAQPEVMRSSRCDRRGCRRSHRLVLRITSRCHLSFSIARSLSGALKCPARRAGAAPALSAANFSVGSARR